MRFRQKGKLKPNYVGPYEILKRVGTVAYKLELPPELSHVPDAFHVLMLWKYMHDPSQVLEYEPVPIIED